MDMSEEKRRIYPIQFLRENLPNYQEKRREWTTKFAHLYRGRDGLDRSDRDFLNRYFTDALENYRAKIATAGTTDDIERPTSL